MADIHDLDRHIGRYVSLQEGEDGMSGFLVDVGDEVDYVPKPVRNILLDYGYGMRVSADTELTFPPVPDDQQPPSVVNPVRAMHLAMHKNAVCPNLEGAGQCAYEGMAVRALREFRTWRMLKSDAFWQYHFVREVRSCAQAGDVKAVEEIMRDAQDSGAPAHVLDHMKILAERAAKARSQES